MFFADMLRANLLFSDADARIRNPLEQLLAQLGGTLFSNCITSAPDTPRSMGIFFSGQSPSSNGLNRRSMWPGPFLSPSTEVLFGRVIEAGHPLKIVAQSVEAAGLLFPSEIQAHATFFASPEQLAAQRGPNEPLEITFVQSNSYHDVVSARAGHKSAHLEGCRILAEEIQNALDSLALGPGDQFVLFSDHGCKLSNDGYGLHEYINRDRSQVAFYHSDFSNGSMKANDGLFAMEDIHFVVSKLLQDALNDEAAVMPISLTIPKTRELVHVEDHAAFSTNIGDPTRRWAVFSEDFEYFESLGAGSKVHLLKTPGGLSSQDAEELAISYLNEFASDYSQLTQQYESLTSNFTLISREKIAFWEQGVRTAATQLGWRRFFWNLIVAPVALNRRLKSLRPKPRRQNSGSRSGSGSNQRVIS